MTQRRSTQVAQSVYEAAGGLRSNTIRNRSAPLVPQTRTPTVDRVIAPGARDRVTHWIASLNWPRASHQFSRQASTTLARPNCHPSLRRSERRHWVNSRQCRPFVARSDFQTSKANGLGSCGLWPSSPVGLDHPETQFTLQRPNTPRRKMIHSASAASRMLIFDCPKRRSSKTIGVSANVQPILRQRYRISSWMA